MKVSYGKEKSQNIRVLIATIKVRMNYDKCEDGKMSWTKAQHLPEPRSRSIDISRLGALESHAIRKGPGQ